MSDMQDLIARLEAATWPDRELDAEIMVAAGLTMSMVFKVPAYTASLDAALTLVPEGCLFRVSALWDGGITAGHAIVSAYSAAPRRWRKDFSGLSATPALALCIAALRARQEAAS